MLEQLRGRNLAHVGCTLGLLVGLVLGLVAAIALLALVTSTSAIGWAVVVWLGVTVGLGALGYVVGDRSSRRLWGRAPEGPTGHMPEAKGPEGLSPPAGERPWGGRSPDE